jgi:hypothetical protein
MLNGFQLYLIPTFFKLNYSFYVNVGQLQRTHRLKTNIWDDSRISSITYWVFTGGTHFRREIVENSGQYVVFSTSPL